MSCTYAERKKALPAEQPQQRGAQLPAAPCPAPRKLLCAPLTRPGPFRQKWKPPLGPAFRP